MNTPAVSKPVLSKHTKKELLKALITIILLPTIFLLYKQVLPKTVLDASESVFELSVITTAETENGRTREYGGGCGFVVYADAEKSYIVTCAHCVSEEEKKPSVVLSMGDKSAETKAVVFKPENISVFFNDEWHEADVTFISTEYDVAVLQVDGDCGYDPLPLTEAGYFSKVFAVGYPSIKNTGGTRERKFLHVDEHLKRTITGGYVTVFDPFQILCDPNSSGRIDITMSHTAKIYKGNSGGPLLNSLGEVVGINCCGSDYTNCGIDSWTLGKILKESGIPYEHHVSWKLILDTILIMLFVIMIVVKDKNMPDKKSI